MRRPSGEVTMAERTREEAIQSLPGKAEGGWTPCLTHCSVLIVFNGNGIMQLKLRRIVRFLCCN